MVRTRYAPSPTGYMHIGNLKSVIVEYLIAKSNGGKFLLRIEDTDRKRLVDGSIDVIYRTLDTVGIKHDEGPDIGGEYGPYVQSERIDIYMKYAKQLVEAGKAYYCFCDKSRLETLVKEGTEDAVQYDRHCYRLSKEETAQKLADGTPFVIRQLIPPGRTTFRDEVFGEITVDNKELDDQILIKSDGYPTYNFANVVDDHLMEISHVVRGVEYISSTPKYSLLYDAFGWIPPKYVHVGLLVNTEGKKMSKRDGDTSAEDLIAAGFLPEAIVNYLALLGWSPAENREIYTLQELCGIYTIDRMSKAPSVFDINKLTWYNGEYIKIMPPDTYYELAEPYLRAAVKRHDIDLKYLAAITQSRVNFIKDCASLVDFIDSVPDHDTALYVHKKMKTTLPIALETLTKSLPVISDVQESDWNNAFLYKLLCDFAQANGFKNGQVLWPIRTALSGRPTSPCGASELLTLLGKPESVDRINRAIAMLQS